MSWLIAFAIIAAVIALLVGGAVLHPVLYGLFIAVVIIVPIWLISVAVDWLFGIRR